MTRVLSGVLTAGLMGVSVSGSGGGGAGDGVSEALHAASAEARGLEQTAAPAVTEDSAGRLTLTWSQVDGAASYLFFVSRDGVPLAGTPLPFPSDATSFTTGPDPLPAGTYSLRVAGVVGGVIGAASPEVTFAVGIPSAPGQPTAQVTGTTLTSLSWTAAAGRVTRYDLSVSRDGTPMPGSPFNMGPLTAIGPVPDLPPGTYLVSARAYNGATAGAASAAGSFVVAAPAAPGSPGTPVASVSETTLTSLSWPAASGTVTAYKAYVTLNGATLPGTPVLLGSSPAISNVGNLPTGTYTIRIAALNGTLEGPQSAPVTFTVGEATPGIGTYPVRFTRHFIDPAHVQVVTPVGGQTGFGGLIAVRSYVIPPSALYGVRLPVYAPADLELFAASFYLPGGAPAGYQPEYSLFFSAGGSLEVQFYHIKGVVGSVAAVVPTSASSSSAGQSVTRTRIAAGEQIGWYEGEAGRSVAFDFRVEDRSQQPNVFINQSRFESSPMASGELYAKCPYDYYSEALKSIWMSKLGSAGGTVVPGTPCGTLSQGTPGTAHGLWFRPGAQVNNLTFEGTAFSDPTSVGPAGQYMSQILFTTDADGAIRIGGLNVAAPLGQMIVGTNQSTWKRPEELTVGQTHCWTDSRQSVKVQLTSSTTLVAVVGSGSCNTLSLSEGRAYER